MVWQAIGAIGSSLLGGLFGSSGAKKQNAAQIQAAREQMEFQERSNQKQMDFQERMSNTAHQREILDLEKAGLNPILSAKLGGASSPGGASSSGAMPNIVNEMAPLQSSAQSMADKMYNFRVQDAQVNNMKLQNDLLKEQIRSAEISNARQGLMTPAWETGGRLIEMLVNKVGPYLEGGTAKTLNTAPDIVQEVIDSANAAPGILPAIPTGYKLASELSKYTKGSEAGKYYRGEKGFLQSIIDASKDSVKENERQARERRAEGYRQQYELTPERLKAYGIKHLDDIRRRAGR